MDKKKIFAFFGPTVSRSDVETHLPGAKHRPPAARGDLYKETWRFGDRALIIDGYFRDQLSVGHKEILWLLGQGVQVYGCASMGALRAAELHTYGMVGVGSIFNMFLSGEIVGDDEVAVTHGPAELDYCPLSIAMVNIRYATNTAVAMGEISLDDASKILHLAKNRPFFDRTWRDLSQGQDENIVEKYTLLQRLIENGNCNLKRLDAIQAMAEVQNGTNSPGGLLDYSATLSRITAHEEYFWRSRRPSSSNFWMTDFDILNAARLFDPSYPELHQDILSDLLTDILDAEQTPSCLLGFQQEIEIPPTVDVWLTSDEKGELCPEEQHELMMVRVWPHWQSFDWRTRVLEKMRSMTAWADWEATVVTADELNERKSIKIPPPEICGKLYLRHWSRKESSSMIELARRGFYSTEELGRVVSRFFALDLEQSRRQR